MPEHDAPDFEVCAVCGRTILRGERVREYLTADGEPAQVCALCRERADAAGWIPAERAGDRGAAPEPRRRRSLRELFGRRSASGSTPIDEEHAPQQAETPPEPEPARPRSRPVDPAPPPALETPERRMRLALERFNDSDERRKVAGLMRSLGEPTVAVRQTDGAPERILVTIVWELSWYRWEVNLAEDGGVREIAQGAEVSELDERERAWNATVGDDGLIRVRTTSTFPGGE